MLLVYLSDLSRYCKSELVGKWLTLPMSKEFLEKEVKEVLGNNEECFISDYSTKYQMRFDQFIDIFKLNELMLELQEIETLHDRRVIIAAFRYFSELDDVINCLKNNNYSMLDDVETTEDLGHAIVKQELFHLEIPKELKGYIDYETIGEEFESSGYTIYDDLKIAVSFY
jgi:hypothetical protein